LISSHFATLTRPRRPRKTDRAGRAAGLHSLIDALSAPRRPEADGLRA
jgi:hypothetical protein